MEKLLKMKLLMIVIMISFMFFYGVIFGMKNSAIGMMIAMAGFMNVGNDLSYKPKLSFIKIWALLLILGIVAYLNNPISIISCVLTFLVVFGITLTSYSLFGTSTYLPLLMCYLMMMCIPIPLADLPMRLLSLTFGAVFIVGFNVIINRNKQYKLSKQSIDSITKEINNAVDLKLVGKTVSKDNFKTANGFYSSIFSQFEYKYFPSPTQESVLNIVKSFQYIGRIVVDCDLSEMELKYIKKVLANIEEIKSLDDLENIKVETKEMNIVLLSFEYIIDEINNFDTTKETILPDKKVIKQLIKPIIKKIFSFRSVKFTFAFKMAFAILLWEVLTLIFNLPYTKWLYFATIPLMLPYVDDVAQNAKTRVKGTFIGVFIFTVIVMLIPYIPISTNIMVLLIFVICMVLMVYKMENKLLLTIFTTIMSVMVSLMYISLDIAIELKILWVVVAAVVVSAINYLFLPFSVQKETKNNLNARYRLNLHSIQQIKEKCRGNDSSKKTTLLVVSNILGENVEITDENKELFDLQTEITDVSNFILTYMDKHKLSNYFKENVVDLIDNDAKVNDSLDNNDKTILYSISYLMGLFKKERKYLIEGF